MAIKILPDAFASDPERLTRFEREAKTLASLNHPHIAAIYGFEKTSGTHALVMELVEGEDLSLPIARGAIPIEEALPIAKQIAEALEAAHEQGIIHRDLKPDNIKLRADGTVKVLDLGLAKAIESGTGSQGPGAELANSPTITTPAMTQAGMILGTAAYRSPEQAKGRRVDRRADIWAFGAVLYEMLTAHRAFAGEDVSDTLANVLKTEPDCERLPTDLPARIRQVLRACLQKHAKQRLGDMQDVRLALDGAFETAASQAAAHAGPVTSAWRRALPVAAAAVLAAAIVGGAAWRLRPAPASPAPVAQFSIAASGVQGTRLIAFSADGTRILHAALGAGLYVRAIGDVDAHLVPGIPPSTAPASAVFSPDGESIVFYASADNTLKRIPVSGGPPLTIAQGVPRAPSGIIWDESGIVFSQDAAGVFRVSPAGGKLEPLATVAAGEVAYGPQILPGGKFLMFTVASTNDNNGANRWDAAHIVVQSLTTGERRTIINGGADARYLPTGHVIFAVAGTVFAVPFNMDTQTVRGDPVAVVSGVRRATSGAAFYSVSNSGSLLFVPGPVTRADDSLRVPTLARRNGKNGGGVAERLTTAAQGSSHTPDSWSPDGHTLLFSEQKGETYALMALSISERRTVPFGGVHSLRQPADAVFSPDGHWVAYAYSQVAGGVLSADRGIFVQPFPATGATYQVPKTRLDFHPTWARSGREIFYVSTINADELTGVSVQTQPSLTFGPPTAATGVPQPSFVSDQPRGYDVLPDGGFITMLPADNTSNGGARTEMRVILNWFEELKWLVPTK